MTKMMLRSLALSSAVLSPALVLAVTPEFERIAQYCNVPSKILYAMGLAESGRRVGKRFEPWPWTLNIEGKGQFFDNREKQYRSLLSAIAQGKSVDIGPMQLNWYWQRGRLRSPWLATDPIFNIKTACHLLVQLKDQNQSDWWYAVGAYHRPSKKPKHVLQAKRYRRRVKHFQEQL